MAFLALKWAFPTPLSESPRKTVIIDFLPVKPLHQQQLQQT
jgi:hypothetical protein